jgi:tetratricopeptide (TPR) repeat protein
MRPRTTHKSVPAGPAALSGWVLLCLGWVFVSGVHAEPCATASVTPKDQNPEHVMEEARRLATRGEYAKARGLLKWVLARHPEDRDVRISLARTDGWEHCYTRAEAAYRTLLKEKPEDSESRAALVDVLLWQDRRSEAEEEATRGLSMTADSAELWQRRAVLYMRADDPEHAITAAEQAMRLAPNALELRVLRDRIFLTQLRAWIRFDYFAKGAYPNLYTAGLQGWHRVGHVELTLEALLQNRSGGLLDKALIDGLYIAGASYHAGPLATFGLNLGIGAPAPTLPRWLGRLWFASQFTAMWGASLSYSLWDYRSDKTAHIIAPALAFTPNDAWFFDLRWWTTLLVLHLPGPDTVKPVHTVGVRAAYQLLPSLRLGASYAYGPQADRAGLGTSFDLVRSHVLTAFADFRPEHDWGLQPLLSLEHRTAAHVQFLVLSVELAAYMRW